MNYYIHHIGDYAEATSHLSLLEDGIYSRLLRKYYSNEEPLPASVSAIARHIGARSEEERTALQAVLEDFFTLQEDGWHQDRCDAEIEVFRVKVAGQTEAKDNAKMRQRRAREHRKALFDELRSMGVVPAFSASTLELTALRERLRQPTSQTKIESDSPVGGIGDVTRDRPSVTRNDTASPYTNPQSPISKNQKVAAFDRKLPAGFTEFWSVWPKSRRKEARGKCADAWIRNGFESIAEQIVAHVQAKCQTNWIGDGGEYIEAPLVYLHQRRWEGAELPEKADTKRQPRASRHTGLLHLNHNKGINEDGSLA